MEVKGFKDFAEEYAGPALRCGLSENNENLQLFVQTLFSHISMK